MRSGGRNDHEPIPSSCTRYPLGIFHVALVTGKLLEEIGVYKFQLEMEFQYAPYWNPIDTCAFHTNLLHMMLEHQIAHLLELIC